MDVLNLFKPITLGEMKEVKLMNRIDTKYVVPVKLLFEILEQAKDSYFVQFNKDSRIAKYNTVYLDTQDMQMYNTHESGRKTREKIRMRAYLDSDDVFLEIKDKNNHGRTKKNRIHIPRMEQIESFGPAIEFLQENAKYSMAQLQPALENEFNRITLVNVAKTERLTIDIGLQLHNLRNAQSASCSNIAIIELKRDGLTYSPMKELLLKMHVHTMGFSKYCIGCALTDSTLRQNNFKERLRKIAKM